MSVEYPFKSGSERAVTKIYTESKKKNIHSDDKLCSYGVVKQFLNDFSRIFGFSLWHGHLQHLKQVPPVYSKETAMNGCLEGRECKRSAVKRSTTAIYSLTDKYAKPLVRSIKVQPQKSLFVYGEVQHSNAHRHTHTHIYINWRDLKGEFAL